jgi:CO dehydrogenase nickel-insertion accessory protein CooC1
MLIVADANMKSLHVAKQIHELAIKAEMNQVFLIGNKIANQTQKEAIENFAKENGLRILDFVPFDSRVVKAEMRGETPLKYKELDAVRAIETLSTKLTKR